MQDMWELQELWDIICYSNCYRREVPGDKVQSYGKQFTNKVKIFSNEEEYKKYHEFQIFRREKDYREYYNEHHDDQWPVDQSGSSSANGFDHGIDLAGKIIR